MLNRTTESTNRAHLSNFQELNDPRKRGLIWSSLYSGAFGWPHRVHRGRHETAKVTLTSSEIVLHLILLAASFLYLHQMPFPSWSAYEQAGVGVMNYLLPGVGLKDPGACAVQCAAGHFQGVEEFRVILFSYWSQSDRNFIGEDREIL